MGQECFVCKKEFGFFSDKWEKRNYEKAKFPVPDGMTSDDRVCGECFKVLQDKAAKEKQLLEEEAYKINQLLKNEAYKEQHKVSIEQKQIIDDIRARVPQYKANWNKAGFLQYKDEYVAILRRVWGAQVEFIIAYSDLTKEGYRLMAQDEGKSGSTGGLTGGVDSYYYFQKMKYVR